MPSAPLKTAGVDVDEVEDDRPDRDGDDRQVVAAQPAQGDQPDQQAEHPGRRRPDQEGDREGQVQAEDVAHVGERVRAAQHDDAGEVGADGEEGDVGEVEDSRGAELQVQAPGLDAEDEEEDDQRRDVVDEGGHVRPSRHADDALGAEQQGQDQQGEGDVVLVGGVDEHRRHLGREADHERSEHRPVR